LNKEKTKFWQLGKDVEKAEAAHTKTKNDPKKENKEIQKFATIVEQAKEKYKNSDVEYHSVLKFTNEKQDEFYQAQRLLLNEYEQWEVDRSENTKKMLADFSVHFTEGVPIYQMASNIIKNYTMVISSKIDVDHFASENNSHAKIKPIIFYPFEGYEPPKEVDSEPVVDLSKPKTSILKRISQTFEKPPLEKLAEEKQAIERKDSKTENKVTNIERKDSKIERKDSKVENKVPGYVSSVEVINNINTDYKPAPFISEKPDDPSYQSSLEVMSKLSNDKN